MGQVRDLIGAPRSNRGKRVLGPAEHAGLKEGTIDYQLTAALEQINQAYLALGPRQTHVILVHSHPRHPPALGGQGVARPRQGLLLLEHLLARGLPGRPATTRGGVCMVGSRPFRSFSRLLIVVIALSDLDEVARHGCTLLAVQRLRNSLARGIDRCELQMWRDFETMPNSP